MSVILDGKSWQPSDMLSANSYRATSQKPDRSFVVDLDVEKGQTPRAPRDGQPPRENKHRVAIKFAKKVQLATVRAYLEGTVDFDNGILEGISKAYLLPFIAHC